MIDDFEQIAHQIAKQTEDLVLEQLNEFIKRGLLIIERGPMSLVKEPDPFSANKISVRQTVKLLLKDQEYIERLEKENAQMKGVFEAIRKTFPGNIGVDP